MLVRILRGVVVDKVIRTPGELVQVDEATASQLLRTGKAAAGGEDPHPLPLSQTGERGEGPAAVSLSRGLIDISGIGVVELDVLAGLEIRDFADLAGAEPKALAKALGVTQRAAKAMIADAIGFAG